MNITSWHSFPKIYALGHRAINELLYDDVIVEEKIDGSQFSFGRFEGVLKCKSKNQELDCVNPEGMFNRAVEAVRELPLREGWTYRGEYLEKPKHNTLVYDRIPKNHVILFDVNPTEEEYLNYDDKEQEAERIGLEVVPRMFEGRLESVDQLKGYLDKLSTLGNNNIEGVVVKNYKRFGIDKKVLMGKFVSEAFKEKHGKEWKKANPNNGDIIQNLVEQYSTQARWEKGLQHLKEDDKLKNDPSDIAFLMKAISQDIKAECGDEIKELLFKWAWGKISRGVVRGLPQWYKEKLMEEQFKEDL